MHIELRRKFIGGEGERYHLLACSAFDTAWLTTLAAHRQHPFLFLAEGVFEIIMAFRVRPHEGWGFLLLSGIAALAVGVLIAFNLPSSAEWAARGLWGGCPAASGRHSAGRARGWS